MPARRSSEAKKAEKLLYDHPCNPPISPFASVSIGHFTDDSSDGEQKPALNLVTPRHARRRSTDWASAGDSLLPSSRAGSPDRAGQKRMPTMVAVLMIPAVLMLILVASVSQGHATGRHQTRSFALTRNWGFAEATGEDAVADFLSIFQEHKPARRQQRIRQLYGDTDPAMLWNASFAAGPVNWPLGSQAAMCQAFAPADVRKIAIVGNGPLTEKDRVMIKASDRVLRFNAVNNMLPEEPVDVWVVRYNEEAPLWYWGLKQLPESEVARIAAKARGLLFLDGPDSAPAAAIQDLLYWFPQMPADKLLQLNITDYWTTYARVLDKARGTRPLRSSEAMPSSGLLGLLAALSCIRIPQHDVHLFGFNWSPKSYYMHKMTSEELIARELILQYRMTVHKPACEALYSCDPKCDSSGYRASIDGTGDDCTLRREARKARKDAVFQEKRRLAEQKRAEAEAKYALHAGWDPERGSSARHARGTPGIVQTPSRQSSAQSSSAAQQAVTAGGALGQGSDPVGGQEGGILLAGEGDLGERVVAAALPAAQEAAAQARTQQEAAGAAVRKQIIAQRLENRRFNPRLHPEKAARSVLYPDGESPPTVNLGLDPKLAGLRRDVLALLTDGHRIEQSQAVRLTGLLHDDLKAKGLAPQIEVKLAPRLESRSQFVNDPQFGMAV